MGHRNILSHYKKKSKELSLQPSRYQIAQGIGDQRKEGESLQAIAKV